MPRTSTAAMAVVPITEGSPRRPEPMPGLSEREVELWRSIVASMAADWFAPGDLPVLAAYCRAIALHERASAQCERAALTVFGPQGGEVVNPVFKVQDMAARQLSSLAVKLRLTQSAKYGARQAHTKNAATSSSKKPWER
jgi:phage terminase small subunit